MKVKSERICRRGLEMRRARCRAYQHETAEATFRFLVFGGSGKCLRVIGLGAGTSCIFRQILHQPKTFALYFKNWRACKQP